MKSLVLCLLWALSQRWAVRIGSGSQPLLEMWKRWTFEGLLLMRIFLSVMLWCLWPLNQGSGVLNCQWPIINSLSNLPYLMTCETIELLTYFQLITNSLTHCVVALLSIESGVYCKALGRRTDRRPSPMEQTPPAQAGTRVEVGRIKNSLSFFTRWRLTVQNGGWTGPFSGKPTKSWTQLVLKAWHRSSLDKGWVNIVSAI